MDDCARSLDGESCDADELSTHLDLVELDNSKLDTSSEPRSSQPSTVNRDDDGGSLSSGSGCNRSSREARNAAEKKRRDTLNTHINELSALVPMVASSSKKMDKTSVLRLAATYLRMNKTLIPDKKWPALAKALDTINLSQFLMEDIEGFLLLVTAGGRIIFASHTIEKYLGHSQSDLMGQQLSSIVHEEDHKELTKELTPNDGFPCYPDTDGHGGDDSSSSESVSSCSSGQSSPGPPVDVTSSTIDVPRETPFEQQRRSFFIRMSQKSCTRGDQRDYELVHIVGDLRVPSRPDTNPARCRSRKSKDCRCNNDIVFVGVGRIHKERTVGELSLLEPTKEEYITRHEPTGKMTYVDHRIAIVAGYMSEECIGFSAFNFMHKDDVPWTMIALKSMYDQGGGYGSSTYRLRAKNGEFIYMKSSGHLEFDHKTQQIESFVCVNTLLSKEEGEKAIEEMKKMYSPHFVAVKKQLTSSGSLDECMLEQINQTLLITKTEVTSSTEVAVRPTVLHELASVQRVSSSTSERSPGKRKLEDGRAGSVHKMMRRRSPSSSPSPLHVDGDAANGNQCQPNLLDLDVALQPISHISPATAVQVTSYRVTNWKDETGSGTLLQMDTRQQITHKTGRTPKKAGKMKTTTQVQQELLCKNKRGIGDVSV